MTDHPLLIATSAGLVGAVVSEPDGERLGAAVLLEGIGGRRSGVNQLWTRTAWDLADRGLVVLRADYPGRGDSSSIASVSRRDPRVSKEVIRWFRDRVGEPSLILVGICYGAQLAAEIALEEPGTSGLALVVPYLRTVPGRGNPMLRGRALLSRALGKGGSPSIDRATSSRVQAALDRMAVWGIIGQHDKWRSDLQTLRDSVVGAANALEVETVMGMALHRHRTLAAQRATREGIVEWASRRVATAARK